MLNDAREMSRETPKTRLFKGVKRSIAAGILLAIASLSAYALYTIEQSNFHVVAPGKVYRSAQMNSEELVHCIKKYGIKSILNLRGENLIASWYQNEITTAEKLNIAHYDCDLGSGRPLTQQQMNDLVTMLGKAPKPVLIHCFGGADRSGLASALYCYAIDHEPPQYADRQLTIWYGHVPLIRPKVIAMDNSFWRYVSNDIPQVRLEIITPK
jgi:protein tyrosine/serine phosphatase